MAGCQCGRGFGARAQITLESQLAVVAGNLRRSCALVFHASPFRRPSVRSAPGREGIRLFGPSAYARSPTVSPAD